MVGGIRLFIWVTAIAAHADRSSIDQHGKGGVAGICPGNGGAVGFLCEPAARSTVRLAMVTEAP